jgi:hypothetical protein
MIKVNNQYNFGDVVYLKTDTEQKPRIVVSIEIFSDGEHIYKLNQCNMASWHYEMELSTEKDVLLCTTN